ncbi:MAG: hypothetical protein II649_06990 [Kiritimatiellae bacterium]|nr:hypothetical protein [Kiritimatiellia bacterium]
MKPIAYAVVYGLACFAGIFVLAFAFFWISELLIPNRPVDYRSLTQDSFTFAVKVWCAAMIVSAIGYFVKRPKGRT